MQPSEPVRGASFDPDPSALSDISDRSILEEGEVHTRWYSTHHALVDGFAKCKAMSTTTSRFRDFLQAGLTRRVIAHIKEVPNGPHEIQWVVAVSRHPRNKEGGEGDSRDHLYHFAYIHGEFHGITRKTWNFLYGMYRVDNFELLCVETGTMHYFRVWARLDRWEDELVVRLPKEKPCEHRPRCLKGKICCANKRT